MFATFPKDHSTNIKWYEKFLSEVRDNTLLVIHKYMTEVEFGNLMRPKFELDRVCGKRAKYYNANLIIYNMRITHYPLSIEQYC